MEGDGHTLSSDGSRIPARATEADVADGTQVCMRESSLVMDPLTRKKLYEFQLDADLQPPVAPHVDRRETFYMLRVSRGLAPGALREDEHARIWAWSDLHLGHTETLHAFGRPFETAAGMDDKIFWNWRRVVAPEDTLLILGDVTVHPLWGRRLKRVRQAPGRKILVYGNHEITRAGSVDNDGFDEVYSTLYMDGDPPLLLSPRGGGVESRQRRLNVATGPPGAARAPDVPVRAGCPRRIRPASRARNVRPPAASA